MAEYITRIEGKLSPPPVLAYEVLGQVPGTRTSNTKYRKVQKQH
jgi:hypothetical protein